MRIALHLAAEQARAAGRWLLATWGAAVVGVAAFALLAGGAPAEVLIPAALLRTAALTFSTAAGLAIPLSVIAHVIRMSETGERDAIAIAGTGPVTVAIAIALPWLPIVASVEVHVHRTEPAALARAIDAGAEAVRRDPVRALASIGAPGVAASVLHGRVRVLAAVGDGCVGLELSESPRASGSEIFAARGSCSVVAADERSAHARFSAGVLAMSTGPRPLSWRSVRELSSGFLVGQEARFGRARAMRGGGSDGRTIAARELRRRAAATPAVLAALVWALAALGFRPRSPAMMRAVFIIPACAIAALTPRLFGS